MWILCGGMPNRCNSNGRGKLKKTVLLLATIVLALAMDIKPIKSAKIDAAILDMVIAKNKIFIATDASKVVIMDLDLHTLQTIKVRKIKDFMGELNNADIYSIDVAGDTVLFLAQAEDGYAELFIHKNNQTKKVLDKSLMLYAKAAKFVDSKRAVLALMSDELVLYDIEKQKIIKRAKAGEYFYSAMAMDKSKKFLVVGDEGGEVIVVDPSTLQRIKLFKDVNKDKILSIFINAPLIAAGSRADKKLALYNMQGGKPKTYKNPDFFVYVVGLSPDNRYVLYGDNEKYILKVADTNSLDVRHRLIGHRNIVNVIRFVDDDLLITGSETGEIFEWRLP